jgi:hypothetical protein
MRRALVTVAITAALATAVLPACSSDDAASPAVTDAAGQAIDAAGATTTGPDGGSTESTSVDASPPSSVAAAEAGSSTTTAGSAQPTAPAPVLGRPIDDGTGLRLDYVPAEYGLAGVQGWPFDAEEGKARDRTLFLNGPGGQVDVMVSRDRPFTVPSGATAITVQGSSGWSSTSPNAVAFSPAAGVIVTVSSPGLPVDELTKMAEAISYDASKDPIPEP